MHNHNPRGQQSKVNINRNKTSDEVLPQSKQTNQPPYATHPKYRTQHFISSQKKKKTEPAVISHHSHTTFSFSQRVSSTTSFLAWQHRMLSCVEDHGAHLHCHPILCDSPVRGGSDDHAQHDPSPSPYPAPVPRVAFFFVFPRQDLQQSSRHSQQLPPQHILTDVSPYELHGVPLPHQSPLRRGEDPHLLPHFLEAVAHQNAPSPRMTCPNAATSQPCFLLRAGAH